MPLSPPVEREHLHTRQLEFRGFRRNDGLWDIEGHLTDVKTYSFPNTYRGVVAAGEPVHDMWLRVTVDDDFLVHAIEAVTDGGPFAACPEVVPNFQKMVGVHMGAGWRRAVRERLRGIAGCTHLVETLGAMGTVAFQTLYPARKDKLEQATRKGRPPIIDTCHAFRSDGEVVRKRWPEFYTGPKG